LTLVIDNIGSFVSAAHCNDEQSSFACPLEVVQPESVLRLEVDLSRLEYLESSTLGRGGARDGIMALSGGCSCLNKQCRRCITHAAPCLHGMFAKNART